MRKTHRYSIFLLPTAVVVLLALAPMSASLHTSAWAQSNVRQDFIPLGRIPYLLQPGGNIQPRFKRGSTPIKFFVDADSLSQNISANLSNLCAHGRFNTARPGRYYVEIETQTGYKKRLGFANSEGFNLRDPENLKGRDVAYLFDLDRTSQCRVYALPTIF